MKIFNEDLEKQLKDVFKNMINDVTIALFTNEDCYTCPETAEYMEEITALSDKIHLIKYNTKENKDLAEKYKVELSPSIVLLDTKGEYKRIKFNGIPAGHEINSFVSAILEVSGLANPVPADLVNRIDAIKKPINIKVFVTLSCPHCPGAVQTANKLALMNGNIEAEMIEAQTFSELSEKYNVSGVPKIVINDSFELIGNQPIQQFLSAIEKI